MKTALSIIGIAFLVFLVLGAAALGYLFYEGSKLDASSQAYVDTNLRPIIETWSKDELIKRESPEFKAATSDEDLAKLFVLFSKLGPLKEYAGSKGDANMNMTPKGLQVTAQYIAKASFQNGNAEILVALIRIDGQWEIMGFRVNSPLLVR